MIRAVVVDESADEYIRLLAAKGHDIDGYDEPRNAPEVLDGYEVLVSSPAVAVRLVGRMPHLRLIQSTWAGVDALLPHVPDGVLVAKVGGVFGPQMSEFVFGYLLAWSQRVNERQHADRWDPIPPRLLRGSNLGVLGTGSIGQAIAATGTHFGMNVRGYSMSGRPKPGFSETFSSDELLRFLTGVDHLVSVLPSTPATRNLLDGPALARLQAGASLINAGRGDTVDVAAVVSALASGSLGLAVLDVLPAEPIPIGDPLWSVDDLIITSHTAAISRPSDIAPIVASNLDHLDAGRSPDWLVDQRLGY